MFLDDTIAAIATPPGEGGVGVIRLSGPAAVPLASRFFRASDGRPLGAQEARSMALGRWVVPGSGFMDELLCVRFEAPHSFTGEDVVELHTHGGAFHMRAMLKTVLDAGARLAEPGEFSKRAFVNGRMDLTRAEAVADLILAGTGRAHDAALRQLAGGLFDAVEKLRVLVVDLSAAAEAALDFPEEEEQMLPRGGLLESIREARGVMHALLSTARGGRLLREGIRVTLAGRPNAGKSSLMNALLGSERSIVSETPGTTRDYIEERIAIQGFPVILTDTAGLRASDDSTEAEGVRRSRERMAGADLILMLIDGAAALQQEDLAFDTGSAGVLWVATKCDLPSRWDAAALGEKLRALGSDKFEFCAVSSNAGTGLEGLKEKILDVALMGGSAAKLDGVLLTQTRHEDAMRRAELALAHVEDTLQKSRLSAEFIAGDLRDALDALGEIVGKTSREDVINAIFSKFCIGK